MLTIPAWLVTTLSRLALLRVVCAKYGRHSQVLWLLCAKSGPKSREATLSVIARTAFVYGLNIHVDRQGARLRKYATLLLLSQDTTFMIISTEGNTAFSIVTPHLLHSNTRPTNLFFLVEK
jgi:hypothetical protein